MFMIVYISLLWIINMMTTPKLKMILHTFEIIYKIDYMLCQTFQ